MPLPAPTFRDFRLASNESVHRTVNEKRAERASAGAVSMSCECECHRAECGASFQVTIEAYEAVRADGRRFLVAPGHQTSDESIISTSDTYSVIEKMGDQGFIADSLDPR